MKILNLFAGLGGNRRTWSNHHVTSVEIDSNICNLYQELYPNDIIINDDVFNFLRNKENNINQYDFIWASPPCQTHSHMQIFTRHNKKLQPIPKLDQIIGLAIWLQRNYKGKYVIENVIPWYGIIPLDQYNLRNMVLDRHIFYSNFLIRKKEFISRGSKGHGKIGGLMRMNLNQLLEYHAIPLEIGPKLFGLQETGHDHLKILRNCCNYKLGEYILGELENNKEKNHKQAKLIIEK